MRLLLAPALIAILALPVPLRAQQQERKLLDRIQRPNMELTNSMQTKSFEGGGGVKMKSARVSTRCNIESGCPQKNVIKRT